MNLLQIVACMIICLGLFMRAEGGKTGALLWAFVVATVLILLIGGVL